MNITATSTETRLYRSGAKCLIQNLGPGAIYVGLSAGVTAASGLKLDVFDAIEIPGRTSGSIYIVSDGTADVRVLGGAVEDLFPAPPAPVTYDVTSLDVLSFYSQGSFNTAFALNSAPTADVTVTLSNFQASDADITINAFNLTGTIAAGATTTDITNFFSVNPGGDDKATYSVDWALSSADANWNGQTGTHTGSTLGFAAPFVTVDDPSLGFVEGTSGAIDASFFLPAPTTADITITGGSSSDSRVTVNNTGQVIPAGTSGSVTLAGLFSVTDDGIDQTTESDNVWVQVTATSTDSNVVDGILIGQAYPLFDNPVIVLDNFGTIRVASGFYYQINPDFGTTLTSNFALGYTPTDDVTIALTSDNANVTVSPATLTFTTGNYTVAQPVTFTDLGTFDGDYATITATVDAASLDTSRVGHVDKLTVWVET